MNETIFGAAAKWLWDHKPDLMILAFLIASCTWIGIQVQGFVNRLETTEEICVDIQKNQIPQLREEMNEKFEAVDKKMDERFAEVDKRFENVDKRFEKMEVELFEIKVFMKKLDTYFATTHKDYPKE